MLEKFDTYIFDLDRTVWDTYDITDRSIWAKQLIPPYTLVDDNKIVDDVGSYCVLKNGIREFIISLNNKNKKLGFLSIGALYDAPEKYQPSLNLLKLFELYQFFNYEKVLAYKTESKKEYLDELKPCVFFDDDEKHLKMASSIKDVLEIDSKQIADWNNLI